MKIALVSSPIYPDMVRQLVANEFEYIHVTYLTYANSYTEVAAIISARQTEFDAVLFSGHLAYDHCLKHCRQEVLWYLVKPSPSELARTLQTAIQKGYDVSTITVDFFAKKEIESAYFENNIDDSAITIYRCPPPSIGYIDTNHEEEVYQFHYKNLTENGATCCLTSYFYPYQMLCEQKLPLLFIKANSDTFRRAFYQLYLKLTEKVNERARMVVMAVDIGEPDEHSIVGMDEFQNVKRRLKIIERVYVFAERLRAIVVEVSPTQCLVIVNKSDFDHETRDFHEFDLFEQVSSDIASAIYFGIGIGDTAIDARQHAYIALKRARNNGLNTACLVAANAETIAIVSYNKRRNNDPAVIDDEITALSKRAGISARRMLQLYQAVQYNNKNDFTSAELAHILEVSKRNMDRIVLKLEAASLASVIGQKFDNAFGRPSRILRLNLEQ